MTLDERLTKMQIKNNSKIFEELPLSPHKPFEKHRSSKTIVVFIHGFAGSPKQFEELSQTVYDAGVSFSAILLPGHGVTGREFAKATLIKWEEHIKAQISNYTVKYEKVVLVGHSMGCLLSLQASLEHKIAGLVLIAPPLKLYTLLPRALKFKIDFLLGKSSAQIDAYRKYYGVHDIPIYIYPLWLKQLLELKKLIRKTRISLKSITTPTYIIASKFDETVKFGGVEYLYNNLVNCEKKLIVLQHSWHCYYTDEEKLIINQTVLELLKRI